MLTGRVSDDLQAWIAIEILAPNGQTRRIEAVLDTGFNGELALPATTIRQLGLPEDIRRPAVNATGDRVSLMTYRCTVLWYGQLHPIQVVEAGGEPLLGMELLLDSLVTLEVREGGAVNVEALP